MEWLAAGFVAWFLFGGKKKPATQAPDAPKDVYGTLEAPTGLAALEPSLRTDLNLRAAGDDAAKAIVEKGSSALGVIALAAGGPVVGPAVAAGSYLTGTVAKEIGGTPLAAALGTFGGVYGDLAVIGAEGGEHLDAILGGAGGRLPSPTSGVAQATLGLGAFNLLIGIFIVPFVLAAGVIIYAVTAVWTDAERLKKGQLGALEDWCAEWVKTFGAAYTQLTTKKVKLVEGSGVRAVVVERPLTSDEATACAYAWVDGYMYERNLQAFRIWMASPRGAGQSALSHARFGRDRAYYVGDVTDSGSYDDSKRPPRWSYTKEYQVKYSDVITRLPVSWTELYDDGQDACNVANYVRAMAEPKGAGLTEFQHGKYWQERGHFLGQMLSGGDLLYKGKTYKWRELAGATS